MHRQQPLRPLQLAVRRQVLRVLPPLLQQAQTAQQLLVGQPPLRLRLQELHRLPAPAAAQPLLLRLLALQGWLGWAAWLGSAWDRRPPCLRPCLALGTWASALETRQAWP